LLINWIWWKYEKKNIGCINFGNYNFNYFYTSLVLYQTKVTNQYDGRNLNIGIIGDIPKVREKQIKFTEIQFSDLGKERVNLDAIFIVEKNMSQNTLTKYTSFSKDLKLPFFFINFKYDDYNKTYATGYIYTDGGYKSWSYNLQNNIENEKNIKLIYSQIFKDISKE